jgi:monoamine oxidase
MREIHDMSGPRGAPAALFGFVPSTTPTQATVTQGAVVRQLTALFGAAAGEPERVLIHDWRDEVFTSPPDVTALSDYQSYGDIRFAEPVMDGRLLIASTETSPVAPGHIEGAIHAGERAAATVLDSAAH